MICVFNFTPVVRDNYRIGVDKPGRLRVLLNSDDTAYDGSGAGSTRHCQRTSRCLRTAAMLSLVDVAAAGGVVPHGSSSRIRAPR